MRWEDLSVIQLLMSGLSGWDKLTTGAIRHFTSLADQVCQVIRINYLAAQSSSPAPPPKGHVECVKLLIEAGSPLGLRNDAGACV